MSKQEEVKSGIKTEALESDGHVDIKSVTAASGASVSTVRRAIASDKQVVEVPATQTPKRAGRPPKEYSPYDGTFGREGAPTLKRMTAATGRKAGKT